MPPSLTFRSPMFRPSTRLWASPITTWGSNTSSPAISPQRARPMRLRKTLPKSASTPSIYKCKSPIACTNLARKCRIRTPSATRGAESVMTKGQGTFTTTNSTLATCTLPGRSELSKRIAIKRSNKYPLSKSIPNSTETSWTSRRSRRSRSSRRWPRLAPRRGRRSSIKGSNWWLQIWRRLISWCWRKMSGNWRITITRTRPHNCLILLCTAPFNWQRKQPQLPKKGLSERLGNRQIWEISKTGSNILPVQKADKQSTKCPKLITSKEL